ncbi:MAG: transcription antitermination factor NusB [Anaerolineae bacterium]|nr:transcription antitermination factor NusB [Anaerolineae bacterium]MCO5192702.1 transcription antitermination factor NusB [Anaerolineae bacterium]MCO5197786.1 transcription antitermination factor NusB [Anaerolineae bacterium]MCO5207325.1 transcription antitermination factor NusB [Anaerolineae bacterium]
MINSRHHARCLALEVLYECDIAGHDAMLVLRRRVTDDLQNHENVAWDDDAIVFAEKLIRGVQAHQNRMDIIIKRYAPEWPLSQIAVVDRNILRIAFFEMLGDVDTPLKVAINEAVELSKAYGSDSTSRFVNGVLGSVAEHQTELRFV